MASTSSPQHQRRAVRRYLVAFGLAVSAGAIAAIHCAVLINQEWQVFPTNGFASEFNVNGRPIANATVIAYSWATGVLLIFAGFVSVAVGFRNWRANNKTLSDWQR